MSLLSDVEILREKARRLNDRGSARRQLSPGGSSMPDSNASDGGEAAVIAAALLQDYDALASDLQHKVDARADEVRTLSADVRRLVAENERLTRDLKAAVELQMNTLDPDVMRGAESDNDAMELLRVQLQLATQERDSSDEVCRLARLEVERLEAELFHLRRSNVTPEQWTDLQLHAQQMKKDYVAAMKELHAELRTTQENLRRSKAETRLVEAQATDLRKLLEQTKSDAVRADHEKAIGLEEDLAALRRHSGDLESRLAAALKLAEDLKRERAALEVKVTHAQKQSLEHEQRAFEAANKVKDTLLMVEGTMLEKDQVALRERQQQEEIERLRDELSKLVHAAGVRTKQEVEKLRDVYNAKLARLLEDVHALEMESGERKAQMERAIREKRAVESELEKVYREGVAASMKDGGKYDQLNTRACEAERLRDEAQVKLDATQGALKRAEAAFARERTKMASEVTRLGERGEELGRELERVDTDRLRLNAELDETAKRLAAARLEKEAAERAGRQQHDLARRDAERLQKELEVKLRSADDAHRQSVEQLRQSLASHQRMAAKWKDQYEEAQLKFERELAAQRAQAAELKQRVEELRSLLSEARDKTLESEKMMAECTAQIRRMEKRVREADARAAEAMRESAAKEARLRRLMQHYADVSSPGRQGSNVTLAGSGLSNDGFQEPLRRDDLDSAAGCWERPGAGVSGILSESNRAPGIGSDRAGKSSSYTASALVRPSASASRDAKENALTSPYDDSSASLSEA